MLSSLQIQNFRGLKDVKINSLGRVNLIVGENNAGKSSVLEALRIYASGGNPYVLDDIVHSHNEEGLWETSEYINHFGYSSIDDSDELTPFISLFYQRKYPENPDEYIVVGEINKSILSIKCNNDGLCELAAFFNSELKYKVSLLSDMQSAGENKNLRKRIFPYYYVSSQIEESGLSSYWDKIILTPYENEVIKSLQIIEPNIEKLAFINTSFFRTYDERIPVVSLKGIDKPVPLNSMGDGMRRILQLILNLHQAKDGILLIDEFDNGLHYKVQEKVWGLLFELAERFNVQVFTTTHSNDCIRAFSKISQARTDIDGMLIQMTKEHYKNGTSQIVANVVDENQLQRLLNLGVDVR